MRDRCDDVAGACSDARDAPAPGAAEDLVGLTVLLVRQARLRRGQLRALEAETGISKTTWSAWGLGRRAAGRERVVEVARRYDPQRVDAWVVAWDRLACADPGSGPSAGIRDEPSVTGCPEPASSPSAPGPRPVWSVVLGAAGVGCLAALLVGSAVVQEQSVPAPAVVRAAGAVSSASDQPVEGSSDGLSDGSLHASSGGRAVASSGAPANGAAVVRLVSPAPDAAVPPCLVVTGTGRPDPGRALLVSVRDWAAPAAPFRLEPVTFARAVAGPGRWTARQRLDRPATYEVLVVSVDARATRVEHDVAVAASGARGDRAAGGWTSAQLPVGARVVAAARVRGAGGAASGCPAG